MLSTRFLNLTSVLMVPASSALAQTPAPGAAPGDGGLADYWWIILLLIVIAGAIWYFTKGRRPNI